MYAYVDPYIYLRYVLFWFLLTKFFKTKISLKQHRHFAFCISISRNTLQMTRISEQNDANCTFDRPVHCSTYLTRHWFPFHGYEENRNDARRKRERERELFDRSSETFIQAYNSTIFAPMAVTPVLPYPRSLRSTRRLSFLFRDDFVDDRITHTRPRRGVIVL